MLYTKRTFTLAEANSLLSVILKITERSNTEVARLTKKMESIKGIDLELYKRLESEVNTSVETWQRKITALGVTPKGLWLADFDSGSGYYCWRYPETVVAHHHGYDEGFSSRKQVV